MTAYVKNNAVLTLALASAFFSFAVTGQSETIYPRDRIFNLAASAIINLAIICLTSCVDFKKTSWKMAAYAFIIYRLIANAIKFSVYFTGFHGQNTDVMYILTLVIIVGCMKLNEDSITQMYSFFMAINFLIIIIIVILSLDKINVINLYSTAMDVKLSTSKFIFFDEIIIMSILLNNSEKKTKCKIIFLLLLVVTIALFTLLQGLCIKGNVLYSISPLQSLPQIFSGETIKRFDYILSLLQTFNYYASVIFLTWGFISMKDEKIEVENEKV